jgi:DNA-directed RNA polymerase subunit RPC12/RpoP
LATASKCRHCLSLVDPEVLDHGGTCPYCKERINPGALLCPHCKSRVDAREKACDCSTPTAVMRPLGPRPLGAGDYGQGCYWRCYDKHVGHGDPPGPVHRYCERLCRVSVPEPSLAWW